MPNSVGLSPDRCLKLLGALEKNYSFYLNSAAGWTGSENKKGEPCREMKRLCQAKAEAYEDVYLLVKSMLNGEQGDRVEDKPDCLMADSLVLKAMQLLSELMESENPETRLGAVDITLGHFLVKEEEGVRQ